MFDFVDENESEPIDENYSELKPEDFSNNLSKYSSECLCNIIICDRYIGIGKDIAIIAMEELGQRRVNGEQFEFETYIDKTFNDLPKIDLGNVDIKSILKQAIK